MGEEEDEEWDEEWDEEVEERGEGRGEVVVGRTADNIPNLFDGVT